MIIDDTGYVQQSLSEMEVLFTLRADRFEGSTVMLTSNRPCGPHDYKWRCCCNSFAGKKELLARQ
ncbi:MAG: ATP-binding protein [Proteobacteria bacterium]|nr:ATP-binding protein [Pseudomonadota bacterium]MBU0966893.1 ATP-binding protein [Pseudomonadota bacterium]